MRGILRQRLHVHFSIGKGDLQVALDLPPQRLVETQDQESHTHPLDVSAARIAYQEGRGIISQMSAR
jgi:hypothetical protein